MNKFGLQADTEKSIAIRAAWLHFVGGLTQAAVAKRLGLTSVKTHRLIARAVADGAVKVTIEGDITDCVRLENELLERFNLKYCQVAPDLGEEGIPFRTLGQAGADYLRQLLTSKDNLTIGLSVGRSLSASISHMPSIQAPNVRFVSLLGGLTRDFAVTRDQVVYSLSQKTGASGFVIPAPFMANTPEDRDVLLAQKGVKELFEIAANADVKLLGIGTVNLTAQLVQSGIINEEEIDEISKAGAIGESAGHFFDAQGYRVSSALTSRTLSLPFSVNPTAEVVAIAGGPEKYSAIQAVLKSKTLTGFITDERTAIALLK